MSDPNTDAASEPMPEPPVPPTPPKAKATPAESERAPKRGLFGWIGDSVRQFGVDAVSVALGRLIELPETEANDADADAKAEASSNSIVENHRRVNTLHNVTEKLRGAADSYIAAKLDEIEARVDIKLNEIDKRIDDKINTLQEQLRTLRDQELRHRLRLLKITLIFTVVVALLSLGYKWIVSLFAVAGG